ncbi:MAG: adenylate/guanylate cyclase domain-containing protein [Thermodesulfobacteriota bacterium]
MAEPTGDNYARRVSAVLMADAIGFSTLMGLDDEGTMRALCRTQAIVRDSAARHDGRADPIAGDAMLCTFHSVVSAVDAALDALERLAAERGEPRLDMRLGVHFGDVLVAADGSSFGDAINVAGRLMALARPGTVCISEGVYRTIRARKDVVFEDLGRQRLKNISDPLRAFLVVPARGAARVGRSVRRRTVLAASVAAAMAVAVAGALAYRRRGAQESLSDGVARVAAQDGGGSPPAGVADVETALGVMLFKSPRDDPAQRWMGEALRDGLNTQLAELKRVKVYSREFLDFLVTRQGLTEIEAATKLGIRKMVSGSVVTVDETVRIETHVVDVASGVLEASYSTVGRVQEFLALQDQVALGVIKRLGLPLSDEEEKALLARKSNDVHALKLLLEAEGSSASAPPGPGSWLAPSLPRSWPLSSSVALAADAPLAEAQALAVLERYRRALEGRSVAEIAAVYAEFPDEQQAAQQRYFENARDLKVAIENVDIAVVGDEAVVSFTRTDDFVDQGTGRPMHVVVRLTKVVKQSDGAWKLSSVK